MKKLIKTKSEMNFKTKITLGYGEGRHLSRRLGGMGEHHELPQQGPRQSLDCKRILAYYEGHRTLLLYLYDKNLRETICTSVPHSKFWWGGACPPRSPPVIYVDVYNV